MVIVRGRATRLSLWMNGQHVGYWNNATADRQSLEYSANWLHSPLARPLSLSLPLTPQGGRLQGPRVRAWFDNLLPDSQQIRERIAMRFALDSTSAFDLLREIGRDCVGALQLLGEDEQPGDSTTVTGDVLDEQQVERLLAHAVQAPGLAPRDEDDFRISIAGAQEKTALFFDRGRWSRPTGSTPTTHILKLPLGRIGNLGLDLSGSVENEWLCLHLLAALGIRVPACDMLTFGRFKVLAVERFDRRRQGDTMLRLPQEDFCQATGTPALRKYESEGGPGMRDILALLANSSARESDRREFFITQLAFRLLAATDGHAKNFSIALEAGGSFRMTPIYDVLSAWPVCGDGAGLLPYRKLKLAMAVRSANAHYRIHEIRRRHWLEMARRTALGPEAADWIDALAARVPSAIERVGAQLPAGFPMQIADAVFAGMQSSVESLQA